MHNFTVYRGSIANTSGTQTTAHFSKQKIDECGDKFELLTFPRTSSDCICYRRALDGLNFLLTSLQGQGTEQALDELKLLQGQRLMNRNVHRQARAVN